MNSSKEENSEIGQISILHQAVKELHFLPPIFHVSSLGQKQHKALPKVSVVVSVDSKHVSENIYSVTILTVISSVPSEDIKFDLTLEYQGFFNIEQVPQEDLNLVLFVYCPGLLFPFVRRVIADVTADAGFPPLMIDVVDFSKLFEE